MPPPTFGSREEQRRHGYSLDDQERELRIQIGLKGWELVEVVRDEGFSGAELVHFLATEHPLIQSFQPSEGWIWSWSLPISGEFAIISVGPPGG